MLDYACCKWSWQTWMVSSSPPLRMSERLSRGGWNPLCPVALSVVSIPGNTDYAGPITDHHLSIHPSIYPSLGLKVNNYRRRKRESNTSSLISYNSRGKTPARPICILLVESLPKKLFKIHLILNRPPNHNI